MKVGIVGCGTLGSAIGERLLDQNCELLVWNRSVIRNTRIASAALIGASPREVAERADVTLSLVAGEHANQAVYTGADGLLAAGPARLIVNLSTLSPAVFRDLAAAAAERSIAFIECPVLGTAAPARQGLLVALAAGDEQAIARAEPALKLFCRAVCSVGRPGAGAAMKLVHNTLLTLYWRATGEAFDFGRASGLALDTMIEVIGDSFAAVQQWPLKMRVLRGEDVAAGFTLGNLENEIKLQRGLFEQAGVACPMLDLTLDRVSAAIKDGWRERDVAALGLYQPRSGELRD